MQKFSFTDNLPFKDFIMNFPRQKKIGIFISSFYLLCKNTKKNQSYCYAVSVGKKGQENIFSS